GGLSRQQENRRKTDECGSQRRRIYRESCRTHIAGRVTRMPRTVQKRLSPEDVYDWLRAEAEARHIKARIYTHLAKQEGKFLHLPVFIEGDLDAYEFASRLQDLESAWNDQEPKPDWLLWLIPAAK